MSIFTLVTLYWNIATHGDYIYVVKVWSECELCVRTSLHRKLVHPPLLSHWLSDRVALHVDCNSLGLDLYGDNCLVKSKSQRIFIIRNCFHFKCSVLSSIYQVLVWEGKLSCFIAQLFFLWENALLEIWSLTKYLFFLSFFLLFYKLIKREDKKESDIYEQIHEDNTRECRM